MEYRERKRWVFFGLPFTFTVYTVKENGITVNMGFLNRQEEDCYMYKVQDVTLKASLFERMLFTMFNVRFLSVVQVGSIKRLFGGSPVNL